MLLETYATKCVYIISYDRHMIYSFCKGPVITNTVGDVFMENAYMVELALLASEGLERYPILLYMTLMYGS